MAVSPFNAAINQIVDEKGIAKEKILETIEAAVAAAYRRDYGRPAQIIKAQYNEADGTFKTYQVYEVVKSEDEIEESQRQVTLKEAKKINKQAAIGGEVSVELPSHEDFGRIAAQTAKQVIIQRLREAEREVLFNEFKDKENHLINGTVQQLDGDNVIISLGKINAVMPAREKLTGENYRLGQRLRVFIKEVSETNRGPQIIATRANDEFIKELFTIEVPEIQTENVEIMSVAREPGSRTKIAVTSHQESLDPVGSCVGQKGTRVQAVLNEIGNEKIDIILWNEKPEQFIKNALSPAKVSRAKLDSNSKTAKVFVDLDQLSLAIGKNGQNVRLASRLTGFNIDVLEEKEENLAETNEDQKEIATVGEEKKEVPQNKKIAKKSSKKSKVK